MNKFAVIHVILDYDYVEDVEWIATFDSEQEANEHIESLRTRRNTAWANRVEYIEKWVEQIDVPTDDTADYGSFVQSWVDNNPNYHFVHNYICRSRFKDELMRYLKRYYGAQFPGYNPPTKDTVLPTDLHVVEIKQGAVNL